MSPGGLQVWAVPGLPLVEPGTDLVELLAGPLDRAEPRPRDGDVLVVAQKIVSKAEGRYVDLATVTPSPEAVSLAQEVDKDPRLVEVILSESTEVVARGRGVLVTAHRLGHVAANAGVDRSNLDARLPGERVLLLPADPDATAAELRAGLARRLGLTFPVIVSDSVGRPWRLGTMAIALGVAGMPALLDLRGQPDLHGRALEVSTVGLADQVAAAAALVMGEAHEGVPAALVRGLAWGEATTGPARDLHRPKAQDLFR